MTMAETSEQALTALERSKLESVKLLSDAAAILGLNLDLNELDLQPKEIKKFDQKSLQFRQQWVLRWLLRKLAQVSDKSSQVNSLPEKFHDDRDFIQNLRTWKLLEVLIREIPDKSLLNILFERNFFKIFTLSLAAVSGQLDEASSISQLDRNDLENNVNSARPRKRTKLSPPPPEKDCIDQKTSLQMIRVAQICSSLIKDYSSGNDRENIRHALPAWSNSISEAAEFLGSLLRLCVIAVGVAQKSSQSGDEEKVNHAVQQWLSLWDIYVSVHSQAGSSDASQQFNKHCLPPILDLLAIPNIQEGDRTSDALKRVVALYTIMPMRTEFDQKYAREWKNDRDILAWADIEPIYEMITKRIDGLNQPPKMRITNVDSSRIFRPLLLLQVSSGLIPRSNSRRWRWEQPWLEALFICLVYFTCPTYMPKLHMRVSDNSIDIEIPEEAGNSSFSHGSADILTEVLASSGIEASLPLLSYFAMAMMSWKNYAISLNAISQLLKMNSNIFIPNISGGNAQICLDKLCERLANERVGSHNDLDRISSAVCVPLLQGFGKTKNFGELTSFLQMRLVDAFYWRTRAMMDNLTYSGALSWDNEDVLREFRSLCFKYSSPTYAKAKLQDTAEDLEGVFNIVGSTNEIFAKLAVSEQFILAFEEELPQQTGVEENLSRLARAAIVALGRATDFQGQRWRLWKTLRVISKAIPMLPIEDSLNQALQSDLFKQLKKIENISQPFQKSSLLMERFQSFALGVEYVGKSPTSKDSTHNLLHQVSTGIQDWMASSSSRSAEQSGIWDGKLGTLKTPAQMWCGCLAQMSANSNLLTNNSSNVRALLISLCNISIDASAKELQSSTLSLPTVAEALLTSVRPSRTDLLSLYNDALGHHIENSQARLTIPNLLRDIIQTNHSKREAERTAKLLTKYFQSEKDILLFPDTVGILELLSQIISKHAVHVGHPENFELLVTSFSPKQLPNIQHELLTATRCIRSIVQALWRRLRHQENRSKKEHIIEKIWLWIQNSISRRHRFDIDNLESIFVLEIVAIISEHIVVWEPVVDKTTFAKFQILSQNHLSDWIVKVTQSSFSSVAVLKLRYALLHFCNSQLLIKGDHANRTFKVQSSVQAWLSSITGRLREEDALLEDAINGIQQQLFGLNSEPISPQNADESKKAESRLKRLLSDTEYPVEFLAKRAQQVVMQFGHKEKSEILRDLFDEPKVLDFGTQARTYLMESLVMARVILDTTSNELRSSPTLSSIFSRIVSLEDSIHARGTTQLVTSIELCTLVLECHPDFINQSNIDTILRSIAVLCTSSCEIKPRDKLDSVPAAGIFERLCDVILLLLSRYRRRLAGRYHLLLPQLQNLLQCLFYSPHHTFTSQNAVILKQQLMFLRSLPHWLKYASGDGEALPPASTEKFSRILQALCNPTTTSARSAHKRSKNAQALTLNDETKKVRRIAAQHMQYLIMTYCQVSLEGYIVPDVKERLLPGLYAVLNAMDMDLMRAMNAAMDTSARAMFKALYDDWVRYGKWNQT